jgi:serine/threonine protein kinase
VLRYYAKDEDTSFIYLALELCVGTIQDLVDSHAAAAAGAAMGMGSALSAPPAQQLEETIRILHGMMTGLAHLHQLHIVHRDIKPVRNTRIHAAN